VWRRFTPGSTFQEEAGFVPL
jgi:hypothetical protein